MKRTNIKDIQYNYAELDLALICEKEYSQLKPLDILVFTMLKNQESLSLSSVKQGSLDYVDEDGNIFIRIAQKKLSRILKISEKTLRESFARLENIDLILRERVGQNKCDKIYIGEPKRTTTLGDYIKQIGLEIKEESKEVDSNKVPSREKLKNIGNKKVVSSPQTNNSKEDLAQSSTNQYINSIAQNKNDIQEESNITSKNKISVKNIETLKSSGIKYIPYKKQENLILNMDTEILQFAIKITIDKAQKPNWNYLLSTYKDLETNSNINNKYKDKKEVVSFNNYNRFRNFDETFTNYSEDEFEDIILKSQKKKFG